RHLLPVRRGVVAPQRVLRRRGAGFRPAVAHEAARHVPRGVLGALGGFLPVPRRLGAPGGVGVQLREGVLLLLVRGGRRECRRLLPLVLQHQTLRRTLGVHRDSAALAYLGGLLGGRLEAAEGGCGNHGGEPGLRPAYHPPSCSPLCVCYCSLLTRLTRTGWDSNPRYPCGHTGFRDRPFQPLTHLSLRSDAQDGETLSGSEDESRGEDGPIPSALKSTRRLGAPASL